jgi:hypothetical protein
VPNLVLQRKDTENVVLLLSHSANGVVLGLDAQLHLLEADLQGLSIVAQAARVDMLQLLLVVHHAIELLLLRRKLRRQLVVFLLQHAAARLLRHLRLEQRRDQPGRPGQKREQEAAEGG